MDLCRVCRIFGWTPCPTPDPQLPYAGYNVSTGELLCADSIKNLYYWLKRLSRFRQNRMG